MSTPQAPHRVNQTPTAGEALRVALGPGFQLSGASDKFLREVYRPR